MKLYLSVSYTYFSSPLVAASCCHHLTSPPQHLNPVQAFQEAASIGRWCQHYMVDGMAGLGPGVELQPITSCHFSASLYVTCSVSTPLFMTDGDGLNLPPPSCHVPSSRMYILPLLLCPDRSALLPCQSIAGYTGPPVPSFIMAFSPLEMRTAH